MQFKKIWDFLKYPPKWLIVLTFCLTFLTAGASLALLGLGLGEKIYSFIVYALAGICLTYAVFLVVIFAPNMKNRWINFLKKFKYSRRYLEDYDFQTAIAGAFSMLINVAFGLFQIIMSIVAHSIWYAALGSYSLILSFTRFGLVLKYYKQSKKGENSLEGDLKAYKNTGICILIFNLVLSGAIVQMIFSQKAFEYVGLMIFVMSAYAFYKITLSIWGLFKAKKNKDYHTQAFRNINLTDALVSLYALQTALIATFNTEGVDMGFMNIITGVAVVLMSIGIGIYMIVKSKKEQEKLKNKGDKNECY